MQFFSHGHIVETLGEDGHKLPKFVILQQVSKLSFSLVSIEILTKLVTIIDNMLNFLKLADSKRLLFLHLDELVNAMEDLAAAVVVLVVQRSGYAFPDVRLFAEVTRLTLLLLCRCFVHFYIITLFYYYLCSIEQWDYGEKVEGGMDFLLYRRLNFYYFQLQNNKQFMSFYTTPRRRHSSLFERMENEIKKISKKLSAAKDSYKGSGVKPKNNHFSSYNSVEDRNPPTVRKYPDSNETTQQVKANTVLLRRKANHANISNAETIDLEGVFLDKTYSHANRIILKLQDENSRLSHRLGKVEQICEDQSYRLGYIKAQLKETSKQLEIQKEKEFKQNCYLTTLLEFYKSKAQKYKKMANQRSEVSIEIGSDNNS